MKKWFKSKTMWVNILTMAVSAITYISGMSILPPEMAALATGLVLPMINVVLRYVTKDEIEPLMKKGK